MIQFKSTLVFGLGATILLCTQPSAAKSVQKATTEPIKESVQPADMAALTKLNDKFRQLYGEAKANVLNDTRTTPIIICYGDHMELLFGEKRDQISFIPSSYTALKIIDHIPLAIFSLLQDNTDKPLSSKAKADLIEVKELTASARPELPKQNYPAPTMARQNIIIDKSMKFIDSSLEGGQVSSKGLNDFVEALRPEILENAYDAVSAQLAKQDEKVAQWKTELGPAWNNIKVVIVSGHMPREQHSSFQYFSKVLGVKREGDKIVCSEGPAEEKDALNLLYTHMLDKKIAQSFFGDRWRMHRDLLSDGAARYLRSHKLAAK
ncbi:MAG: hypothetical protein Q8T09_10690 [Candidatus Melainabacteria bacterium]|nr:hypothetical protein [Candidatus Melainabacteria bacterium]